MKAKKKMIQPEGNFYDKYGSRNPIVRRLMRGFFRALEEMVDEVSASSHRILEAGCGEGHVTAFLNEKLVPGAVIDAFDVSEKVIEEAKHQTPNTNITFYVGNIYHISRFSEKYDLVVCSEVLEHLEEPELALKECLRVGRYIILSVPREPLWRFLNVIRGKYIGEFGNTPGHIQHWSAGRFKRFVRENGGNIIKAKNPLPWTMVLIENKDA